MLLLFLGRITGRDWFIKKVPAYPLISATVHITDNCNSRCITCNQWREHKTDEITTQEIKQALRQLKEMGCSRVGFSGGEPLLRSDIGETINYARSLGFKRISITTNGLLLSRRKDEIIESGITDISVSLDGMRKTHDMVRGIEGGFDQAMKAIDELNKRREAGKTFSLGVNNTLLKYNVDEISELLDLCEGKKLTYGFNLFDTSPYFFQGVEDHSVRDGDKIDGLLDYIKKRKRGNGNFIRTSDANIEYSREYLKTGKMSLPCYLGMFSVYVGSKGEVYSACYAKRSLGNLREKPLKEIMSSEAYSKRIVEMYHKQCPGCTCNYGNNIRIEKLITAGFRLRRRLQ